MASLEQISHSPSRDSPHARTPAAPSSEEEEERKTPQVETPTRAAGAPRASSAGSVSSAALAHSLGSPSGSAADAAFPVFRNQVAGHSPLLWHKGTVCKPLNPTEYFFYSQLIAGELAALTPFTPKFYGILDMSYIPVEFQKQQVEKDQRKAEKRLVLKEREAKAKMAAQQAAAAAASAAASRAVSTQASPIVAALAASSLHATPIDFTIDATALVAVPIPSVLHSLPSSHSIPLSLSSAALTSDSAESTMSSGASASATPTASPQHQMNTWVLTCQKRQKASARSADVTSQHFQEHAAAHALAASARYATLPASFEIAPDMLQPKTAEAPEQQQAHDRPADISTSTPDSSFAVHLSLPPTDASTPGATSASAAADESSSHQPQSSDPTPSEPLPQYIVLEDLTFAYDRPCILDLKLGTRQHGIHDSPKKIASKIEKCMKTTSGKLGLRLCLTRDHSVLVKERGWTAIDLVRKGDQVWSLAGLGEEHAGWSSVVDEVVQPLAADEELVHLSSGTMELLCTRQHSMWTRDGPTGAWTNEFAAEVRGDRHVALAAPHHGADYSWSPAERASFQLDDCPDGWCQFIGCVLACGALLDGALTLPIAAAAASAFLGQLPPAVSAVFTSTHAGLRTSDVALVEFFSSFLSPSPTRDRVAGVHSDWLFELSQHQASQVLTGVLAAPSEGRKNGAISIRSAHLRDALMAVAALAGASVTCAAAAAAPVQPACWTMTFRFSPDVRQLLSAPVALEPHHRRLLASGQHRQKMVYCITVRSGNFLVRRDLAAHDHSGSAGVHHSTPIFVGNCGMQVYHPTRKSSVAPMTSIAESSDPSGSPAAASPPADGKFVYYDKYYGRSLTEDSFLKTLKLFFWNGEKLLLHIILLFLERLDKLRATLELRQMNKYRFYSSSLLMVYEGQTTSKAATAPPASVGPTDGGWSTSGRGGQSGEFDEPDGDTPVSAKSASASATKPRPDHYPALSSLSSSHRLHDIVDRSLSIGGTSAAGTTSSLPRSHSIDFHQVAQSAPQSLEAAAAAASPLAHDDPTAVLPATPKAGQRQTSNTRSTSQEQRGGGGGAIRSPGSPPRPTHSAHNSGSGGGSSGHSSGASTPSSSAAAHLDAEDLLELHQILSREVARIEQIRREYNGIVEQKTAEEKIEEQKRQRLLREVEARAQDLANGIVTASSTVHSRVVHHAADSQTGLLSHHAAVSSVGSSSSDPSPTPAMSVFSPTSRVSYVHVSAGSLPTADGQRFNGHQVQPASSSIEGATSLAALQSSPQPPSPLPVPSVGGVSPPPSSRLSGHYASSPAALLPMAPSLGAPSASAAPKFYNRVRKTTHAQARERARLKGNIDIRLIDYAQVVKWERGEERAIVDVDAGSPIPGAESPPATASADVPAVDQGVGDPGLLIGVNNLIYFISNIVTQEITTMLAQEQARMDAAAYVGGGRSFSMAPRVPFGDDPITRTRTPPLSEAARGASGDLPTAASSDVAADAPSLIDSSSHTAAFSSSHVPKTKAIIIAHPTVAPQPTKATAAAAAAAATKGVISPHASSSPPGLGVMLSKRQTM